MSFPHPEGEELCLFLGTGSWKSVTSSLGGSYTRGSPESPWRAGSPRGPASAKELGVRDASPSGLGEPSPGYLIPSLQDRHNHTSPPRLLGGLLS